MKSPRRSLAYAWAEYTLKRREPRWFPWLLVAMALLAGITSLYFRSMNGGFFVATFSFAVLAVGVWCKQGYQEVFAKQQRLLDNAQKKSDAQVRFRNPEPMR